MDKKKLMRLVAVCTACLGMGVFAFSGCKDKGSTGDKGGNHEIVGDDKNDDKNDDKTDDKTDDKNDDKNDEESKGEEKDPVISGPVQGGPTITKASKGELETAYVEWTAAANTEWYNVYYSPAGENAWTKLDAPLVRQYKDYFRADMVGLKAGEYDMKVVPVSADDKEAVSYAATASEITVKAHTREGFAFVNGTASGAYNEDGTLRTGAKVIYVTDENKDSVSVTLNTGKKDEEFSGLQNILNALKKTETPLAIRFVGSISSPEIDGKNNKDPDTVLVKECTAGVTLEGIGSDTTANGWTLRLVSVDNVEVRNLGFMNTQASEPDDVTLEKDTHVWVHNCDFFYGGKGSDSDQAKGDGALDTKLSSYITHSFNHFYDTGKSNLQGMKKESVDNFITYHHNWYDHSDSRHPRIRTCTTHVYNNYFDGNAKYCVGVTTGASAFVENNYFRSTSTIRPMLTAAQGTDAKGEGTFSGESGGVIKAFGNFFDGKYSLITQNDTTDKSIDCYLASTRDEKVPAEYTANAGSKNSEGAGNSYNNFDTAKDMYTYKPDTAEQAKVNVERYAGRVDGGDFKWEFDDAKEDANYSIITELKAALNAYDDKILKIGKEN
ncbi:MAG: pectate lyase [Clostridia bacterium]|nr:pectate lyase [Clostridia bacterium]